MSTIRIAAMMIWEAVLLGLLQGLTEFLPVSSSGHLVLGQHLLGIDPQAGGMQFEVFLHFGTVLSIATIYRREVFKITSETAAALARPRRLRESLEHQHGFRTACLIALTMIPTGAGFLVFRERLTAAFTDPHLVCAMLLVTATFLVLTTVRTEHDAPITWRKSLLIGCAQASALLPGISRSGATIAAAIFAGIRRETAANFSFLMSFPVIVIATLVHLVEMWETPGGTGNWLPMLIGTFVAYLSGMLAIRVVLAFVKRGKLQWFAIYCYVLGIIGLVYL